ncbi:MAG TPA: hypothetical protein VF395_07990, partial [Polyangiaceae bacterium]
AADGSGLSPLTPDGSAFFDNPALSPDGRFYAAAAGADSVLGVFPLTSGAGGSLSVGAKVTEFPSAEAWGWSRDSTQLLAGGPGGALARETLLCAPAKKTCENLGIRAYGAVFAPDGRSAVLTATDGIRVLDLASRASRLVYPAPEGTLRQIALAPDGRSLYFLRDVTEGDIWVGTFR